MSKFKKCDDCACNLLKNKLYKHVCERRLGDPVTNINFGDFKIGQTKTVVYLCMDCYEYYLHESKENNNHKFPHDTIENSEEWDKFEQRYMRNRPHLSSNTEKVKNRKEIISRILQTQR